MTALSLTYLEIDLPVCTRSYGVSPCTASIPETGADFCFNTRKTCQVREAYDEDDVTLRFARPADYLPVEIDAIPSIAEIAFTPATISLGENLGTRATLQVTFVDHPHSDTGDGFDPYLDERDYDPWRRGTFWGKFRARHPFLTGRSVRLITGLVGQSLAEMETRYFIVDSFDGPTPAGRYTLSCKDVLKLADGDRAQAPRMSSGFLQSDISSASTNLTLSPTGAALDYPNDGYIQIGGKEVIRYHKGGGDVLSFDERGLAGTVAQAHKAQDRVQVVLRYDALDPANIITDLLVNYSGVSGSQINVSEWLAETEAFLGTLYSAWICEPTSVATLISELIQQACLVIWQSETDQNIKLKVLRGVTTGAATFSPDVVVKGSLDIHEQPTKRVSRVQIYFGQISPLKSISDVDNYRSSALVVDEAGEEDYGSSAIKTIYSRWIPPFGRAVAERAAAIHIGRYSVPPRRAVFTVPRYNGVVPALGIGYRLTAGSVQDASGAPADIPIEVTRINPQPAFYAVEAEENAFVPPAADVGERTIVIDSTTYNFNLNDVHDGMFQAAESGDVVTCIINSGVLVGCTIPGGKAFDVGTGWASGVVINLIVNGTIQGRGGDGGDAAPGFDASIAPNGGTALFTRYPINLSVAGGQIWG
ncbi:MAG: hypothetical protein ACOY6K_05420, partial [Pseudomonadota bacterium]